jgi:thiol-disulfide isomerase/thioredoxin
MSGGADRRCGNRRATRVAAWAAAIAAALAPPAWGGAAPDFRATSTEGDTIQLSSFRGRVVIVDFWASWCPPCREQLERLAALEKQQPNVVVLAVNVDTRRDKVEQYARRVTLPRRVLLDPGGRIASSYAVQGMPWTVLVDPEGRVSSARAGWSSGEFPKFAAEVKRLASQNTSNAGVGSPRPASGFDR